MIAMYNPQDYYFKKAKQVGYKARSAFKLDEIDQKFHIFSRQVKTVLDIGCAPGSWMQYAVAQINRLTDGQINRLKNLEPDFKIIGFDIKKVDINIPGVHTFVQDITNQDKINQILSDEKISHFDVIISDMAPNTIGVKEIDAIRSIGLLEQTIWIYKKYLKPDGKFIIKIFMGPGFDQFVLELKKTYGGKNIKVYKPKACRSESKETYIIKI